MRRIFSTASLGNIAGMSVVTSALLLSGQARPAASQAAKAPAAKPAAAKPAATPAKPASPIDKVITMAKSGLSEEAILKAIAREHLTAELSSDDMIKMKQAGVTERVMDAMEPTAAPSPGPEPAVVVPSSGASPSVVPVSSTAARPLRRAAVDEFEWAAVRTYVDQVFGHTIDIGKGIRSLLTTRIQQGGKVRIVERAKLDTLTKEGQLGASNLVRKGTNARVGQFSGADIYLMGDIVAFGRDDRKKSFSGGMLGYRGPGAGIKFGSSEEKAVIVINYRIVDAETSEVIDSGEARGESKRKSKGLGGLLAANGGVGGGAVEMSSSNFANTIIGEATMDACDKLAAILNEKASSMPAKHVDVEARVAAVGGGTITLAAGSTDGVNVGDQFEVFRILGETKDPVSGEVLDLNVEKLGEMTISTVRDRVAIGQYSGKSVTVKDGLARKKL